ncbi:hypothetical protein L4C33_17085, partial [Vibrio makurazakiensis]|uniref:hypothetical protein n=1 Tax=Vibrio makurazakiensis TaxID=2910250 RepID=UPI003D0CC8D7
MKYSSDNVTYKSFFRVIIITLFCLTPISVFGFAKVPTKRVSSVNTDSCITVYQHENFKGVSWGFCPGREHKTQGWENTISSIKVKKGYKAILCRDKDRYGESDGLCREYNKSIRYVGSKVNDKYEYIKVMKVDNDRFDLIIASDTQYPYCVSEACKTRAGDGYLANAWHSESMRSLAREVGDKHFSGTLINGDITNTMNRKDILQFERDYSGMPIYPGLGNHDYDNYIDDKACIGQYIESRGLRLIPSQNFCATRLIDWFIGRVLTIPKENHDVNITGRHDKNISGSLSYSFNKNNWHVIQLNNGPHYERQFKSFDWWFRVTRKVDIKKSYDWLAADLAKN